MDWVEANLSLQLAAELRLGALGRLVAEFRRSQEDAAFEAMKAAVDGPR